MRAVITGGYGFLGWHLACRLKAMHGIEAVRLGRQDGNTALLEAVASADVVFHLAGVNRADSPHDVRHGNIVLAEGLATALEAAGRPMRVVYGNSIKADGDSPYGHGKFEAARVISAALRGVGGSLADVRLPNLFGEHGRPNYNSFVATFCATVANGETPTVAADAEIPLLHAQRAAQVLMDEMEGTTDVTVRPPARRVSVSAVLDLIHEFDSLYRDGQIPALTDDFRVDLFNTYRSYTFPQFFPFFSSVHQDSRGLLTETTRVHGGTSQSFVSTTRPGQVRGNHYHLQKVERFFVVRGSAEINLRRLFTDKVATFRVDGKKPGFVDMPTMWTHNIVNVGDDELVTVFWADQLHDQANPDQYAEVVDKEIL